MKELVDLRAAYPADETALYLTGLARDEVAAYAEDAARADRAEKAAREEAERIDFVAKEQERRRDAQVAALPRDGQAVLFPSREDRERQARRRERDAAMAQKRFAEEERAFFLRNGYGGGSASSYPGGWGASGAIGVSSTMHARRYPPPGGSVGTVVAVPPGFHVEHFDGDRRAVYRDDPDPNAAVQAAFIAAQLAGGF